MVALLGLPGRLLPCQLPRDAAGLPPSQNLPPLSSGALDAPGRAGSFWAGVQQTVKVETDLGALLLAWRRQAPPDQKQRYTQAWTRPWAT